MDQPSSDMVPHNSAAIQFDDVTVAEGLLALMNSTRGDAIKMLPVLFSEKGSEMGDSESNFLLPADLKASGWEVKILHEDNVQEMTLDEVHYYKTGKSKDLEAVCNTLGENMLKLETARWMQCNQNRPFVVDGISAKATGAYFHLVIDTTTGFMGAMSSASPTQRALIKDQAHILVPVMNKWSDLAFISAKMLDKDFKTPRFIARVNIWNPQTNKDIENVLKMYRGPGSEGIFVNEDMTLCPPHWPGLELDIDSNEAKLLLQTVHGKGVAWFLIQHKEAFGDKTISKVTLFQHGERDEHVSMIFHVADAEGVKEQGEKLADEDGAGSKELLKADLENFNRDSPSCDATPCRSKLLLGCTNALRTYPAFAFDLSNA